MKFFLLLLFPFSLFAQTNLFETYLAEIEKGDVTQQNYKQFIDSNERTFFKNIVKLADEIKFDEKEVNYVSVKDNAKKSLSVWNEHSEKVNIKNLLKKISQDPNHILENPNLIKTLKENRKFAHLIRESFYNFDQTHTAPKVLEKFVKPFGKLNDAILTKDADLIKKYAELSYKGYKKISLETVENLFKPLDMDEFKAYFKSIKSDVSSILGKKKIVPHDFHTLRKQYKRFLFVYHNMETQMGVDKFKLLDNYITNFGELNDIYTDARFRFGFDLDDYSIDFPKKFKLEIEDTIHFLEEDMSYIKFGKSCAHFYRLNSFF